MARRKIFRGAYYIQDTHWGTHFIYIQNIHLEHTLELHPFYIRALARIYIHYNSIQKLHFQHTLDFHQACPVHLLVHRPFAHSPIAPHKITPILFTFRNYISIRIRITFIPHLHPCLHLHSQAFYHIIITFRTYIRITFIFHRVTYFAFAFLFTL